MIRVGRKTTIPPGYLDTKALDDKIGIFSKRIVYIEDAPYNAKAGLDSTSAFTTAYANLSDGDIIVVPKGIFNIAAGISTSKKIGIIGVGKDSTTLNFTHTNGAACISYLSTLDPGISKVFVTNLTIVGNAQTGDGLYFKYVTDSPIYDVEVKGCGRDGIHFEKGWINEFERITVKENKRHGIYIASLAQAYSEANAITIRKCNLIRNEKIGIVVGDETNSYSENNGYCINIQDNHFSENGVGNIQISGARVVNINNGNYFEVVGTKIGTYGGDPFHIYVGKRSGSGIGMCQEVNIHGNHFNAMNDSRYGANNSTGYAIVLDWVIGASIGGNHFYQSVQGSILATVNAKRIWIEPNSVYESAGIPFLTDQTTGQVIQWNQVNNTVELIGEFTGNTFLNQGFENLVRNGDFALMNGSNPAFFTVQNATLTKDTDNALIITTATGGFTKILYTLPSSRLEEVKGKYINLIADLKALSTNVNDYYLYMNDGVTETTTKLVKNDTYGIVSVLKKVDSNATKLEFAVMTYASTTNTTDKVYVKRMRAVKGRSSVAYQKAPVDFRINKGLNVSVSPPNGVNDAYSSSVSVNPDSDFYSIDLLKIKVTWNGTFGGGETHTIKIQANYSDGTNAYVEKTATATGSTWLTDDDILTLIKNGVVITSLSVFAKSSLASSSVTKTVQVIGYSR